MSPPRIQVLSDHVANKIAAGEVVERPASVVKELVENALDAGATRIEVEVVQGGRKAVILTDNGSGMGRDDALLCLERHATSKIRDAEDIEAISTLGFRGEAMPAIASVSRFSLITRTHDALEGTRVDVVGGKIQEVGEYGCPPGTRMEVRNLFFNTPARRKFLRTEQTELTHIRQMLLTYAVGHPAVHFRLVADGREWHLFAPCDRHEDRIADVYGADTVADLLPIRGEDPGLTVHGWIGHPRRFRKDRKEQHIFVNGRPASAPVVGYALGEAFSGLLAKGCYPVAFLFIEIDAGMVDVNVHPMKKEVRFRAGNRVRDLLAHAFRSALQGDVSGGRQAESVGVSVTETVPLAAPPPPPEVPLADRYAPIVETASPVEAAPESPVPAAVPPRPQAVQAALPAQGLGTSEQNVPGHASPWKWFKVLGVPGDRYAVLETDDGVVLLDPRASHERVLYEQLSKQWQKHGIEAQGLLAPETVTLPPRDAGVVSKNVELLSQMGFEVAPFGGDSFLVEAVPAVLSDMAPQRILEIWVGALQEQGSQAPDVARGDALLKAACKEAVGHRKRFVESELEGLVTRLGETDMPYTSPSGRPTMMLMGFRELDRRFGRG